MRIRRPAGWGASERIFMKWYRVGGICIVYVAMVGCLDPFWSYRGKQAPPPISKKPMDKPFFKKPFLLGAHRGGGSCWPENTLNGFREACRIGLRLAMGEPANAGDNGGVPSP